MVAKQEKCLLSAEERARKREREIEGEKKREPGGNIIFLSLFSVRNTVTHFVLRAKSQKSKKVFRLSQQENLESRHVKESQSNCDFNFSLSIAHQH